MQEFFANVFRYPRYLISFSLGVFFNAVEPLLPLLKRPSTAIALISAVIASFIGLVFTMQAMLGIA
ncbi:MAG: DUF751 family protein [Cyanobacteria bacterium P01_C01_bin.121]